MTYITATVTTSFQNRAVTDPLFRNAISDSDMTRCQTKGDAITVHDRPKWWTDLHFALSSRPIKKLHRICF